MQAVGRGRMLLLEGMEFDEKDILSK